LLPALAAAFGPDLIVSQHGADSHAWDPLAHLNVTTTGHGRAARLVDQLAHRYARGRWLATGGGGYDAYRVVPRTWSLTWLAGAHLEVPASTADAWRDRWTAEATRYGQVPLPAAFDDGEIDDGDLDREGATLEEAAQDVAALARRATVPRLLTEAIDRGWWNPMVPASGSTPMTPDQTAGTPTILRSVDVDTWARLTLQPGVAAPADPASAHRLIGAGLVSDPPARASAAVVGSSVVGLAVSAPADPRDGAMELLGLGVAPAFRRQGLAGRLLAAHAVSGTLATVTLAERDVVEPLERGLRESIARRLLEGAGFVVKPVDGATQSVDPMAIAARLP
jgi:ribosomal protein S18 acetylase RimI-like enzyme